MHIESILSEDHLYDIFEDIFRNNIYKKSFKKAVLDFAPTWKKN